MQITKIVVLFFFISSFCYAQTTKKDSLWKVWKTENNTLANRVNALIDYIDAYTYSNPKEGLNLAKKAITHSKTLNDTLLLANAYSLKARSYFMLGDLENSFINLKQSTQLYTAVNAVENILINKRNLVGLFHGSPHLDATKEFDLFEEMDSTATVNKLWKEVASVKAYKARRLEEWGNYLAALEELEKVEQLLSNTEVAIKERDLMNIYSSIGAVYNAIEEYTKSKKYYQKAAEIALKLDVSSRYVVWLATVAEMQLIEEDTLSAIKTFKKSFAPFSNFDANNYDLFKVIYQSKGLYHYLSGDFKKATNYLNQQVEKCMEVGDLRYPAKTYLVLAEMAYKNGSVPKAIELNNKGLEVAKKLSFVDIEEKYLFNLYQCYNKLGNYKKSLAYLSNATTIKDSLINKKKIKAIAIQEAKNEFAVTLQKTKNSHKQEVSKLNYVANSLKKQTSFLIGLSIVLVLGIVVLYYSYKNYKQKQDKKLQALLQRIDKMIKSRNIEDKDILSDLTRRENEIYHLLQNNKTYKEISQELYVSENTIKFHVKNIYKKMKKVELELAG